MKEHILDIPTKDGAVETFVCHPERGGPYPPVLFLMDAPGIRAELYDMTRRLASCCPTSITGPARTPSTGRTC